MINNMRIYHIKGRYMALTRQGVFYGRTRIEAITNAMEELKLYQNGFLIV